MRFPLLDLSDEQRAILALLDGLHNLDSREHLALLKQRFDEIIARLPSVGVASTEGLREILWRQLSCGNANGARKILEGKMTDQSLRDDEESR